MTGPSLPPATDGRAAVRRLPYGRRCHIRRANADRLPEGASGPQDRRLLAAIPVFVGGLRLLDGNYAGPLIKVRRVDTSATIDIYPTSSGALDTAAIATFCGSAVGMIATIDDHSGAGRNATTAVTTSEYRIWTGSTRSVPVASPSRSLTRRTAATPSAFRR